MLDHDIYHQMLGHLKDTETLATELIRRQQGRIYYLNSDIITEVHNILVTESKIKAIKHLRKSLEPFVLLPLKDAKHVVDQLEDDVPVEYTQGHERAYRIFRGV